MLVYKYRGANFERDLTSLEKNFYWSPKFVDLNDPCETLINTEPFKIQSKSFAKLFGKEKSDEFQEVGKALDELFIIRKKGIGIYSLSKTFKDELLWAHYANSHKGFCIEYDLKLLANTYKSFETFNFPVLYTKKPPQYTIRDINKTETKQIVQKLAGYKSERWNYEQEHRIVTGFYGEHPYEPSCLKGIYFGLNMQDSEKSVMIERLKGRNIQFFQMVQKYSSYEFDAIKVNDLSKERYTYLKEIPPDITSQKPVKFEVVEKMYIREGKAMVTIQLESKIDIKQLEWVAHLFKNDMFRNAKRIFISFILKNLDNNFGYWATAKFEDDKLESSIQGLTIKQEKLLIDGLKNETRTTIGMWIDETPYVCSSLILLKQNDVLILETNFCDGTKSSEKLKATKMKEGIRYDNIPQNTHGEYFIVDNNGLLNYYSEDGIFKSLQKFKQKNKS